jgi:hypothetical protein
MNKAWTTSMRMLRVSRLMAVALAAAALAGCETNDGSPPSLALVPPQARHAMAQTPQAEPPMTRVRAAQICWAKTERGPLRRNLDKRADVVTRCIADTLQAAHEPPRTQPKT